jgi:dihydropteroate synthase
MEFKDTFFSRNHSLNCRGKLLDLTEPVVMGILNLTPDSFYDGGLYLKTDAIDARVKEIIDEGAAIIDIGAVSTRPGASEVTEKTELERLLPVIERIRMQYPDIIISADTYRANIARLLIEKYSVDIINDITGGEGDKEMYDLIAEKNVPYILMHMKGNPENMQKNPVYNDVVNEILSYLAEKTGILREKGVNDIIIDPGFGFGKNLEHNYRIMASLEVFRTNGFPVLIGISRKSMVYRLSGSDPSTALMGTSALHMYALMKGANILRVHDVKTAVDIIAIYRKLNILEKEA